MLKLRLINGPDEGRQLRVSDTNPVSIGRNNGRLRLHDSRVSKRHAEITLEDGQWVIRDVGSSNGTYVNQTRVHEAVALETGDTLQIGRITLNVIRADDIGMDLDTSVAPSDQGLEADHAEPSQSLDEHADTHTGVQDQEDNTAPAEQDADDDLISLGSEPFDIDAAFDDLAQGLDDTAELP